MILQKTLWAAACNTEFNDNANNEIGGMAGRDLSDPQQRAENAAQTHEREDDNASDVSCVRRELNFRRKLRAGVTSASK